MPSPALCFSPASSGPLPRINNNARGTAWRTERQMPVRRSTRFSGAKRPTKMTMRASAGRANRERKAFFCAGARGAKRPVSTPFGIEIRFWTGTPSVASSLSITALITQNAAISRHRILSRVFPKNLRFSRSTSLDSPLPCTVATTGIPKSFLAAIAVVAGEISSWAWMRSGFRRLINGSADSVNVSEASGLGPGTGNR